MQKRFKQVVLLAAFVPAFAMAQTAVSIDSSKQAAIRDLLDAMDAQKMASAMSEGALDQTKQAVPNVLLQELQKNTTISPQRKQALLPRLRDAIPRLQSSAGQIFATEQFRQDVTVAQYGAYAKYYSTDEIRELTAFYRSPTGRKVLQVQGQVTNDIMESVMRKYGPRALEDLAAKADGEIAAANRR